MAFKTDIEIAQETVMQPITERLTRISSTKYSVPTASWFS